VRGEGSRPPVACAARGGDLTFVELVWAIAFIVSAAWAVGAVLMPHLWYVHVPLVFALIAFGWLALGRGRPRHARRSESGHL
jgi:hypothetical protein